MSFDESVDPSQEPSIASQAIDLSICHRRVVGQVLVRLTHLRTYLVGRYWSDELSSNGFLAYGPEDTWGGSPAAEGGL